MMSYRSSDTLEKKELNSINRRQDRRTKCEAKISYWDRAGIRPAAVIECSDDGARVVISESLKTDDTIGVIVEMAGRRIRTFARVAWTSELATGNTIMGLEFLRLGFEMAS